MNKESVKVIPECLEKIGNFTPARHRETRKTIICTLPFAVLIVIIRYIHKERMTDKRFKHEETMLQIEYAHEEKMAEIKAKLLNRVEESKHEKDN